MSNTPTNNNQEEIDLGYLIKKINQLFNKAIKSLYHVIQFYLKHKYYVIALIVIGIAYGIYKDHNTMIIYNNEAIVIPNFESVDYLYGKVEALNQKIALKDTVFLKEILDTNHRKIRKVEIEPIVDIYNFISRSRAHIDIFRILFQNQEMSDFVEDIITSKYYKYHRVNFIIIGDQSSEKIVNDLFQYINTNEHFSEYQDASQIATEFELAENAKMMSQIDSVFKTATSLATDNMTSQSVFINDNSQLGNLLVIKKEIVEDRIKLLLRSKDETEVVKLVSTNYNLQPEGFVLSNLIKYPILLIFLFSFIFFMIYVFKKLKTIAEDN